MVHLFGLGRGSESCCPDWEASIASDLTSQLHAWSPQPKHVGSFAGTWTSCSAGPGRSGRTHTPHHQGPVSTGTWPRSFKGSQRWILATSIPLALASQRLVQAQCKANVPNLLSHHFHLHPYLKVFCCLIQSSAIKQLQCEVNQNRK